MEEIKSKVEKLGYYPGIIPPNEKERQAALDRYGIVDSEPEPSYDNLVCFNCFV